MAEKSESKNWSLDAKSLIDMSYILWANDWLFSIWGKENWTLKEFWLCIGGIINRYHRNLH